MKRSLLCVAAGLVAMALSAAIYSYCGKTPATLSGEELRVRTASPSYSGLLTMSKRCTPKVLRFGDTPSEIRIRKGEKPTGLVPLIAFQILESGEVTNAIIKQSSGIRDRDDLALRWVRGTKYNNRLGCGVLESEMGVTIDY